VTVVEVMALRGMAAEYRGTGFGGGGGCWLMCWEGCLGGQLGAACHAGGDESLQLLLHHLQARLCHL
jgi:hypothetical protein